MKLGQVFQAVEAWRNLAALKMKPQMAYQILKYVRLVLAEYEIAEKQRVALIHELTETRDGEDARIETGTPEFAEYIRRFSEVMETECDLAKCEIALSQVMASIAEGEKLSMAELEALEPFFAE